MCPLGECLFGIDIKLGLGVRDPDTAGSMGCFGRRETEEERNIRKRNKRIDEQIKTDKQKYKATHRLLLLGLLLVASLSSVGQ